jgi:hypothetical protein
MMEGRIRDMYFLLAVYYYIVTEKALVLFVFCGVFAFNSLAHFSCTSLVVKNYLLCVLCFRWKQKQDTSFVRQRNEEKVQADIVGEKERKPTLILTESRRFKLIRLEKGDDTIA